MLRCRHISFKWFGENEKAGGVVKEDQTMLAKAEIPVTFFLDQWPDALGLSHYL